MLQPGGAAPAGGCASLHPCLPPSPHSAPPPAPCLAQVTVPTNWECQGFGRPQYTNFLYPFPGAGQATMDAWTCMPARVAGSAAVGTGSTAQHSAAATCIPRPAPPAAPRSQPAVCTRGQPHRLLPADVRGACAGRRPQVSQVVERRHTAGRQGELGAVLTQDEGHQGLIRLRTGPRASPSLAARQAGCIRSSRLPATGPRRRCRHPSHIHACAAPLPSLQALPCV